MTPFDYLNSINDTKKNIMIDDLDEKQYNAYIINHSLSYFPDTVLLANEMNRYHHLDKNAQYHFLLHTVRKRKRFSKWLKAETSDDINAIKEYYQYNDEKARQAIKLLTRDQIESIKVKLNKGGSKIKQS